MAKNIVVFSDGTGQEGGKGHGTNVYKLFNMVVDRTDVQISFYDRGLGTGWRKLTGNMSGMGISRNIMDCYQFVFENYRAGDQVYLFGFSRGATTVRSLSGFLRRFGLLPLSRPELIRQAYGIYKIPDDRKRNALAEAFLGRHHTMRCDIRFLGVWDTVDALGIPFKSIDVFVDRIPFFRHRFHDLKLSPNVEVARHALAIDDERLTFHPKLWDELPETDRRARPDRMKQVWFAGMHTDVGGGYEEQELSDVPLIWLLSEAVEHGLKLYHNNKLRLRPDARGTMHDSRGSGFARLYRRRRRSWDNARGDQPRVHRSVLDRAASVEGYDPWILGVGYEVEEWAPPPEHCKLEPDAKWPA